MNTCAFRLQPVIRGTDFETCHHVQRKADATTLSEWRAATDEERERVLDVRRSRMHAMRDAKLR